MPQAIVDPEELRQFARNLKRFNAELRDKSRTLGNQLTALGTSWRDQEHRKFAEEFEQHMRVLAKFAETVDEHIPYLMKKAAHVEDYLNS